MSIGLIGVEQPEKFPSVVDNRTMIGNRLTKSLFVIAAGLAMTNACGQVNYDAEREALVAELREYSQLSELAGEVYTIEIIDMLGQRAARDLERLGYDNVTVRLGDGYAGWPEHAPFDAIIVTAAPDNVPQPLIDQLAVGGRMVIPVGPQHDVQVLQRLTKEADGEVTVENITAVRFVPLTRDPEKE